MSEAPVLPEPPEGPRIWDVLESAAAAAGLEGAENRLGLPASRRVVVALVDGMGMTVLKRWKAHAPFLSASAERRRRISTSFPSTTATALTSFGTGKPPGEHGILGYDLLAPDHPRGPRVVNHLGKWDPELVPEQWQPVPTVLERLDAAGIPAVTVSQKRFAGSGLTRAGLRGGTFVGANSHDERVTRTVEALSQHSHAVVYAYWNEVDKAGHEHGMDSAEFARALEDVDFALKRLVAQAPEDTLVLVTADHGMLDVPEAKRLDYSEHPELTEVFAFTAGEPRMVHLYWREQASADERRAALEAWRAYTGRSAVVMEKAEALAAGWFGEVAERNAARIGDVIVAATAPVAFFDGRRVGAHAFEMIGQHGSLTPEELAIPLYAIPAGGGTRRRSR